jgi:uncharacterized protein YdhG (YjbR/CyaY superfamily)
MAGRKKAAPPKRPAKKAAPPKRAVKKAAAKRPSKTRAAAAPRTIDAYLAALPPERRAALQRLRETITKLLPDAEECISYGMPAFRLGGHVVAGFQATAKGCSYYPFSGSTLGTLGAELAAYDQTKSALHFDPERPLPATLVRKLLSARVAETRA